MSQEVLLSESDSITMDFSGEQVAHLCCDHCVPDHAATCPICDGGDLRPECFALYDGVWSECFSVPTLIGGWDGYSKGDPEPLYECQLCAALVRYTGLDTHAAWHFRPGKPSGEGD
jgi:hypothetical protein